MQQPTSAELRDAWRAAHGVETTVPSAQELRDEWRSYWLRGVRSQPMAMPAGAAAAAIQDAVSAAHHANPRDPWSSQARFNWAGAVDPDEGVREGLANQRLFPMRYLNSFMGEHARLMRQAAGARSMAPHLNRGRLGHYTRAGALYRYQRRGEQLAAPLRNAMTSLAVRGRRRPFSILNHRTAHFMRNQFVPSNRNAVRIPGTYHGVRRLRGGLGASR